MRLSARGFRATCPSNRFVRDVDGCWQSPTGTPANGRAVLPAARSIAFPSRAIRTSYQRLRIHARPPLQSRPPSPPIRCIGCAPPTGHCTGQRNAPCSNGGSAKGAWGGTIGFASEAMGIGDQPPSSYRSTPLRPYRGGPPTHRIGRPRTDRRRPDRPRLDRRTRNPIPVGSSPPWRSWAG